MNTKLVTLIEGAIIAAVAMALSFIPIEAPNAAFDLSLGLIPLAVYAVRRGFLPAVCVGFVWGLLHIVLGRAYILSIPQVIFEYPFAFAFGGFFGLYAKQIRTAIFGRTGATAAITDQTGTARGGVVKWVVLASVTAVLARWIWHFIAGAVVWAEYMPETFLGLKMTPWFYSFLFNGASFVANAAMLIIVITALIKAAPRLFRP
jgi:thiamine transporter